MSRSGHWLKSLEEFQASMQMDAGREAFQSQVREAPEKVYEAYLEYLPDKERQFQRSVSAQHRARYSHPGRLTSVHE